MRTIIALAACIFAATSQAAPHSSEDKTRYDEAVIRFDVVRQIIDMIADRLGNQEIGALFVPLRGKIHPADVGFTKTESVTVFRIILRDFIEVQRGRGFAVYPVIRTITVVDTDTRKILVNEDFPSVSKSVQQRLKSSPAQLVAIVTSTIFAVGDAIASTR